MVTQRPRGWQGNARFGGRHKGSAITRSQSEDEIDRVDPRDRYSPGPLGEAVFAAFSGALGHDPLTSVEGRTFGPAYST
jgi:hypothetical protein